MGKKYTLRRRNRWIRRIMKCFIWFILIALLLTMILLFLVSGPIKKYQVFAEKTISNSTEKDFYHYDTSYIYDNKNKLLASVSGSSGKGDYLYYDQIPKKCIHAFVAVEDRTFFENEGYDPKGILRVIYHYIKSLGKEATGASTITQQLVRLQYLTQEKTISRKLKEIFCAMEMTNQYTKEEIMEFYVNNCYFANGVYGIEAAAKHYFGKPAKELSLSQMAYLCAIPNRPSYYDPRKNVENAIRRRDKILKDMLECRYINLDQYEKAIQETIEIKEVKKAELHDYQSSYAIYCAVRCIMKNNGFEFLSSFSTEESYQSYQKEYEQAYKKAKEELYAGGYEIHTSLDNQAQETLQDSLDSVFYDEEKDEEGIYLLQGAATVIDNKTGKVIAIVGGRKQENGYLTYNRAFQSYRQPGSTIKPLIVYTPALASGYTPNSIVYDIDVTTANRYSGQVSSLSGTPMTLRYALENSKNGAAYYLFNEIGVSKGLSHLIDMNFAKIVPDDYTLSSSLGGLSYGVNTVEMAAGYSCLVNDGQYKEPTCITSIKNKNGEELYQKSEPKKIYEEIACEEVIDIMKGVLTTGTAKDLAWNRSSNMPAAGKTGTTNDNKDGWFCGMTPYYTISVWVGYDTPKTLDTLKGSSYPASIWKNAMLSLTSGKTMKDFSKKALEEKWGQEKYLPGRDDSEVIGYGGYTVRNYRDDRKIGEKIQAVLSEMRKLDVVIDEEEINEKYQEALSLYEQIISRSYKKEMMDKIDKLYQEKKRSSWPIF